MGDGGPVEVESVPLDPRTAYMRRYRSDPENRVKERKEQAARKQALEELAKAHPDEFHVLVNEKRFALGLPAARKRGQTKRSIRVHESVVDPEVQAKCPHNEGLHKSAIGLVCNLCDKRIK